MRQLSEPLPSMGSSISYGCSSNKFDFLGVEKPAMDAFTPDQMGQHTTPFTTKSRHIDDAPEEAPKTLVALKPKTAPTRRPGAKEVL
jgi:hypothetical protein